MRISYAGWESIEVGPILEHVPDAKHDKVIEEITFIADCAYDEGKEAGMEIGEQEAFEYGRADDWASYEIKDGNFDEVVRERAEKIGFVAIDSINSDLQQYKHIEAEHHVTGPIGWEFCARC